MLPEKGDLQECKNYKVTMLLSVPGKVLIKVILATLKRTFVSVQIATLHGMELITVLCRLWEGIRQSG